ncbi:hypothetical protein BH10PLA1_BH10PLA1_00250 [soil metagenome]
MRRSTRWWIRIACALFVVVGGTVVIWNDVITDALHEMLPIPAELLAQDLLRWRAIVPSDQIKAAVRDVPLNGTPARWYKLTMDPAEVPMFRIAMLGQLNRYSPRRVVIPSTVVECSNQAKSGNSHSTFWDTEDLVEPDGFRVGPYSFDSAIFSPKSGTVLLYFGGY